MKSNCLPFGALLLCFACGAPVKDDAPASTVALPYTATYSSQFDMDVPDEDLLLVLNSYKAWEDGDMTALRGMFADTITFDAWWGEHTTGPADPIINNWATFRRDSLSATKVKMAAWAKLHSIDKNTNFINVWFRGIDTYKSGKIDSADFHDFNIVRNGKIVHAAQYKRSLMP